MIPNLLTTTVLTGAILLAIGLPFFLIPGRWEAVLKAFPRCKIAAWVTMGIGGGWFLYNITQLPKSDFGDYKWWFFGLFLAGAVGALRYVDDLLPVRGLAVCILLMANTALKSAYGLYEEPGRLVMVSIVYAFIVAAIWYGTAPYQYRDMLNWLYARALRARVAGGLFIAMGLGCLAAAVSY